MRLVKTAIEENPKSFKFLVKPLNLDESSELT